MDKTVFIYDEELVKFFILEGDYRHLDGVYLNSVQDIKKQEELDNLIYSENGGEKVTILEKFPIEEVIHGAYVITVGFLM